MEITAIGPRAPEPPDEELIRRFRVAGDAAAFEALVHRYEHELFGYLHRYLHSVELAEDVFQATFLRIHLRRDGFDEARRFRPWLFAIATNQAIDALRRERRHRRAVHERGGADAPKTDLLDAIAAAGSTPAEQVGEREERQRMRKAVQRLSAVQRRAVELVYGEGLAYRDAAAVMGVPVGTVKSRLHSALVSLGRGWAGRPLKRAFALAK